DRSYASFGPEVAAAYAASQEVVRETVYTMEPAQRAALLKRYGTLKGPATLESQLSRETWALLEQRLAEIGRTADSVPSMQPGLVSFAVARPASFLSALDPLPGIADPPTVSAQEAKPVVGLRSLESQLRMLAALPGEVQELMLRSALGDEAPSLASAGPERT